jgi:hypothetical protein
LKIQSAGQLNKAIDGRTRDHLVAVRRQEDVILLSEPNQAINGNSQDPRQVADRDWLDEPRRLVRLNDVRKIAVAIHQGGRESVFNGHGGKCS